MVSPEVSSEIEHADRLVIAVPAGHTSGIGNATRTIAVTENGTKRTSRGALARMTGRSGRMIGLLGGSFDPPHSGHLSLSKTALKRFGLDQIWWLVSPGNPLKENAPAPVDLRIAAARALIRDPRIKVTDAEVQLGTRYTAETLALISQYFPRHQFVWLMGADNLAQIHRWQDWQMIFNMMPVGIVARPDQRLPARFSKAATIFSHAMLPAREATLLPHMAAPAWSFVNMPMRDESSSALRAGGNW